MSERVLRLKHPTGWFAAGRVSIARSRCSRTGRSRLYIHLCLTAERSTCQVQADHADLAKALGKSRRSVVVYLEELRRQGVCKTQPARNQHGQGQIEICDAFWPYERPPAREKPKSLADYTAHICRLLAGRACVKISFSPGRREIGGGVLRATSAD
jgi:hypothetical protein